MNKIEDKLQEALFFYKKMEESVEVNFAFKYFLSAFLSASRSVLQYLLEEVKGETGGQYWYDNKISKSDILKFFKDKRDINIHKNPVEIKKGIGIKTQEKINISESVSIIVRDNKGNIKDKYFSKSDPQKDNSKIASTIEIVYSFDNWSGDENVLELSKKYLQELNKIVSERGNHGVSFD